MLYSNATFEEVIRDCISQYDDDWATQRVVRDRLDQLVTLRKRVNDALDSVCRELDKIENEVQGTNLDTIVDTEGCSVAISDAREAMRYD